MPEIVLTEEQARVLAGAEGGVVVRNPAGETVGMLDPKEAAFIAAILRRRAAGGNRKLIPAERVRARLAALQAEWDRTGGFDRETMRAHLARLRAEAGDA